MSKKKHYDWHSLALGGSAIVGMTLFLYFLRPILTNSSTSLSETQRTIENAYYDEHCFVNLVFSDGSTDKIATDFTSFDPSVRCYQAKWIYISEDKKYAVFEGADWKIKGSKAYPPGNYIGFYFASNKQYAIWQFGSAKVSKATLDRDNNVSFNAVYEEVIPVQYQRLSLPYIESHFTEVVDLSTRMIQVEKVGK